MDGTMYVNMGVRLTHREALVRIDFCTIFVQES
jgi:hypothetical protein